MPCLAHARSTALNYAVTRGDVEIVQILLENGADPYVENDLGMNAFDITEKLVHFHCHAGMLAKTRKISPITSAGDFLI